MGMNSDHEVGRIELKALGPMELSDRDGNIVMAVLTQPMRCALLGFLAIEAKNGFQSRDRVMAMLWPEASGTNARRSLSQLVYSLRQHLGSSVITSRGDDMLGINRSELWCDVNAFEDALEHGDAETALSYYRGDLFEGLYLSRAPEFEQWLEGKRARVREQASTAAWELAEGCKENGNMVGASQFARRAWEFSPFDEGVLQRALRFMDQCGHRTTAMRTYEEFKHRLVSELEVEPSPETQELVKSIRTRVATAGESRPLNVAASRSSESASTSEASSADNEPVRPIGTVAYQRLRSPTLLRVSAIALILTGLASSALVLRSWSKAGENVAESLRRTFIVLSHRAAESSLQEDRLALGAEDELTRLLTGWVETRAVPKIAKPGLKYDLGIPGRFVTTLGESFALARRAGVGTLITLIVETWDDSALVEAQLYDVATERELRDPIISVSALQDTYDLVAPVAAEIFYFSGAPGRLRPFERESNSLNAIQLFRDGREHLERWQLVSAESLFRRAVEQDATYARAHYLLAVTLYWQAAQSIHRLQDLGGEIRRHAAAARRDVGRLLYRDSLSVVAFAAFVDGSFQRARRMYAELVRTDSTDTYAWLFLGSVEYRDIFAQEDRNGVMVRRGDLNLAQRAFTEAVRLSPDFYLGYGHLFDIYSELANAAQHGVCLGYQPPTEKVILFWETRNPIDQVYLCPVVRDSIEWIRVSALSTLNKSQLLAGATRFYNQGMIELQRWSDFALEDDPRPKEELVRWLLAQPGPSADWDRIVADALRHAQRAIALKHDTIPEDLIRLGSLLLTTGDVQGALSTTERAIDLARRVREVRLPRSAANVFLATGQVANALDVIRSTAKDRSVSFYDSVDNRSYAIPDEFDIARLQVYGATSVSGIPLRNAFDQIEGTWADAGYDADANLMLRKLLTNRIRTALIIDEAAMTDWFDGWEPSDSLLAGFRALDNDVETAHRVLDYSIEENQDRSNLTVAYLTGVLAQRLGRHHDAVDAFSRLDKGPFSFATMDVAWGLRSLSYWHRAASYQALVDNQSSAVYARRFMELWANADSHAAPVR